MKNLIITKNVLVHEFMINLIKIYNFFLDIVSRMKFMN